MVRRRSELKNVSIRSIEVESSYLERKVLVDVYMPGQFDKEQVSLLLLNDGQDLVKMHFDSILDELLESKEVTNLCCVAIHCGAERKLEYGTAFCADYVNRGNKAGLYTKFIFDELLPNIRKFTGITSFLDKSFAGFSLGGLSALDIVWNHPSHFKQVGIFSASLWWRRKAYEDGYKDENDRLMHLQVEKGAFAPWLKFYIQCGTLDETSDRNNNGIIDSIDDALDLIRLLKAKGYDPGAIEYIEMADGRHDVPTWAKALPGFLKWGWGN